MQITYPRFFWERYAKSKSLLNNQACGNVDYRKRMLAQLCHFQKDFQ